MSAAVPKLIEICTDLPSISQEILIEHYYLPAPDTKDTSVNRNKSLTHMNPQVDTYFLTHLTLELLRGFGVPAPHAVRNLHIIL